MKFIHNDPSFGIDYDWNKIKKEYEKLNTPSDRYQIPWDAILQGAKYFEILSKRSTGKTTNWILLGMVMNKLYGTEIQYIRATEDELKPTYAEEIVTVLRTYENGYYIKKITNGEYNDIYYHWRKFYYQYRDENGNITKKSDRHFMTMLSVDNHEDYKSTYNAPYGDIIIFDEFIRKYYPPNECINFMDLTKTIIRDRLSPIIVMLANNTNFNSQYFEELEISREIKKLSEGKSDIIVTDYGTKMYIEYVGLKLTDEGTRRKDKHNSIFYGFKNPKLASITGGQVWAFESVQHIPDKETQTNRKIIFRNLYLKHGIELLQLEIIKSKELGLHLEVHRANRTYEDSIILTLKELESKQYYFGLGNNRLYKILKKLIEDRRVYYSSNEVGSIFKDYIKQYKLLKNNY